MHTYRGRMGDCAKTNSADLTVVMTVPTNWAARYSTKNYFVIDPIFQEDAPYFQNDASGIVRDLQEDADQCPDIAELLQDAEKHGLGNIFIAVSARSQKGAVGCSLFSFDISPDEDREQFVAKLRPRLLSLSGSFIPPCAAVRMLRLSQAFSLRVKWIACAGPQAARQTERSQKF